MRRKVSWNSSRVDGKERRNVRRRRTFEVTMSGAETLRGVILGQGHMAGDVITMAG